MFELMVFAQGHAAPLLPTIGADIRTTFLREALQGIAERATEVRHTLDHHRRVERNGRSQSRPNESGQDDKWSFCLTAGTLCPANQERQ